MAKNLYCWKTEETAFLFSCVQGLVRLMAIIATFLLWSCLMMLAVMALGMGFLNWRDIDLFHRALGIFSVTPVLLTVFSWRIIEKIFSTYLLRFAEAHTQPQH